MYKLNRIHILWPNSGIRMEIQYEAGTEGELISIQLPDLLIEEAAVELSSFREMNSPLVIDLAEDSGFNSIQLRENTEYTVAVTLPYPIEDPSNDYFPFLNPQLSGVMKRVNKRQWKYESEGGRIVRTVIPLYLNFKSHVGVADLTMSHRDHPFFVEVTSSKMEYFNDFNSLVDDISEEMNELALQAGTASGLFTSLDEVSQASDLAKYFQLRSAFHPERLPLSVETILANMKSKMVQQSEKVIIGRVRTPHLMNIITDAVGLQYQGGGPLAGTFRGYTPRELYETHKTETRDIPENRFIKYFLEDLLQLCERLRSNAVTNALTTQTQERSLWSTIGIEIDGWIRLLDEWLLHPTWREIGVLKFIPGNSQILQKKDGYRDVFHTSQSLESSLQIDWNPFDFSGSLSNIRPIFDLYEIWCFLKLKRVMDRLLGAPDRNKTDFITEDNDKLSINLKKGVQSRIYYEGQTNGRELNVALYYNRKFSSTRSSASGSYSIPMKPDYTIEADNGAVTRFLHFDAKYRVNYLEGEDSEDESEQTISQTTNKRDDMVKMHAYKDAIRNTVGAYILYPGDRQHIYSADGSGIFSGVGAFPLRPGHEDQDSEGIYTFLKEVLGVLLRG